MRIEIKFTCPINEQLQYVVGCILWSSFDPKQTKSKSIKVIYIYASERSRYVLLENGIVYYAMTYYVGDIRVWIWRILLNFCWVSIFFDIVIANISWTVAKTSINHIIFWKSVLGTCRCIYLTCFNILRFLSEVSTILQKMRFFGQFKDHNSGRKHKN